MMVKTPKNNSEIHNYIKEMISEWNTRWAQDFFVRFPSETYKKNIVSFPNNASDNPNLAYLTLPSDVEVDYEKGVNFVDLGEAYIAVRSLSHHKVGVTISKGRKPRTLMLDSAKLGHMCGFVLEVGGKDQYPTFQEFKKEIELKSKLDVSLLHKEDRIIYTATDGNILNMRFNDTGYFEEPLVDWGYGTQERHMLITSPPFRQPDWPKGKYYGRQAEWSVNGEAMDMDGTWPVYDGPKLTVKQSILTLRSGDKTYTIDYSSRVPVFR